MGARSSRRQILQQFVTGAAAVALTGCGFWSRSEPQPRPTATPPRPTPTVTPTPASVRFEPPPSVVPPAPSVPSVAVTRAAGTPGTSPTALPVFSGSGQLLYSGTLDGRRGIILADLATNTRKLLTTGHYEALSWSPDGSRFAALGLATPETQTQQLAIFAADGRVLARFPAPDRPLTPNQLHWSPDGRHLLCQFSDPTVSSGMATWVVGDAGAQRLPLPADALVWGWLPNGRLAYIEQGQWPPTATAPMIVWTVDPQGDDPRQEARGPFFPFGTSPDGTIIYMAGGFRDIAGSTNGVGQITAIFALDTVRGTTATIFDLTQVAVGETAWLVNAAVAPDTGLLAVVRGRVPVAAQQNTISSINDLLILDPTGTQFSGDLSWEGRAGNLAWSPNGLRLAFHAVNANGQPSELRVISLTGEARTVIPLRTLDPRAGSFVAWSSNNRLLAYVDAPSGGLIITEPGTSRTYPLAADGTFPVWRPRT